MESGALAAQRAWRAAAEMRAFNDDSGSEISLDDGPWLIHPVLAAVAGRRVRVLGFKGARHVVHR